MLFTRRHFLQSSGAVAAYLGVAPAAALATPFAPIPVARRKTLVLVFLRGGIDGLNLVVPHADPEYRRLRPTLHVKGPGEAGGCVDLDGRFGLHPRARVLHPFFADGRAVAIEAVGYDKNTRSHFEEQDTWETGVLGNTIHSDGWVNRHLQTSTGPGPIRALSIGDTLPRILRGEASTYALRGLDDLTIPGKADRAKMGAALERAYGKQSTGNTTAAEDLLAQTGQATLAGMAKLQEVAGKPYKPNAQYPKNGFANRLKEIARLIKADVGVEVAEVDFGGWDTHNNQGGGNQGPYADRVAALCASLAAFQTDLGQRMDDVLLMTLSEFGRTARQNGTNGTDHGWGNVLMAFGGAVKRGHTARGERRPVIGDWPGLTKDQLNQGRDLRHTTDFRDVIGEAVKLHLGNGNLQKVLPSHGFKKVGFVA